jgi:hypothetical protein
MRGAWVAVALLASLVAGCAGQAPQGAASPLDGLDVQPVGSGKGAVAGVVVDEAIRPVIGAAVALAGTVIATTNEKGVFVLDALEPGFVLFSVSAPGFLDIQATADVRAGETTQVRVQLPRDLRPQPYQVTYSFDGIMHAWGGIAQYYVEEVGDGSAACGCRLHFTPEPNATTLVYEAYWEPVLPDPAGLGEYYWVVDQPDGEGREADYCFSPCVEHIGMRGFTQGAETYARLDGPDAWFAVEQPFKLFVTVWHNGAAPDGWTLANGTP